MRQARLQAETRRSASRARPSARQPGAESGDLTPRGRRQHRPGRRHPAEIGAPRQAHIKGRSAPGSQFAASQCPAGSVYGYARAVTPLLDSPDRRPRLPAQLRHHAARPRRRPARPDRRRARRPASTPTKGGGIRASFENVPDVPVSKLVSMSCRAARGSAREQRQPLRPRRQGGGAARVARTARRINVSPVVANGCKKAGKAARRSKRTERRAGR